MQKKIKIIYLHGYLSLGGAEELRITVLPYLNKDVYDITVCSLTKKGIVGKQLEKKGIKVVSLGKSQEIWDPRAYLAVYSFLKKEKPDILQCCMFNSNVIGAVAGRLAGLGNIIWEVHNKEVYIKWWHILITRILVGRVKAIITCSYFVKDYTSKKEGIAEEKFVPIINCIDPKKFGLTITKEQARKRLNLPLNAKIGIIVGRLHKQKGHEYLISAWEKINKEFKDNLLLIVGDGGLRRELEISIQKKGLESTIKFLGIRTDVPELMKASDVLVLPSIFEGFGIVLLEAMQTGIPVVASDVGGIPEIIKHDWNGLLSEPKNAGQLYKSIKKVLTSKSISERLVKNGKKTLGKKFHPNRYVEDLERIYEKIT